MLSRFGLVETHATAVRVGEKYGRLEVIAVGQKVVGYRYYAICKCSCGSPEFATRFEHLKSGMSTSCGCKRIESTTTHGLTKSPHYGRWRHIIDRCTNSKCRAFKDYGGRGIKVCDRWMKIQNFIADLPDGYAEGMEIDRINNDGNYEPGNVRWVMRQENCSNRRSNREITFDGRTMLIAQWARVNGIPHGVIHNRLDVLGWTVERALTEPVADRVENMRRAQTKRWAGHVKPAEKPRREILRYEFRGRMATIAEMSEETGISVKLLRKRIQERGWPVEKATAV